MIRFKNFCLVFCCCCCQLIGSTTYSQNADINILKSINPQYPTSRFWKGTSSSYILVTGTAALGSIAYGFIQKDPELKKKSFALLMGIAINVGATGVLKSAFNRARPSEEYPNDVFVLTISHGHSFPSGHTSLAFATATSLTLAYKKWYIVVPAYLWAGCVGYSRMYLGKHYPTDVLAGAVVGTGSSLLSHWLAKKLFDQPKAKEPAVALTAF